MATTVHMQPIPARPSMDHSAYDQSRPRSTPPFTTTNHVHRSSSPANAHPPRPEHSRSSSIASSAHSPYAQPFNGSYFPQQTGGQLYALPHSQSWSTTALPASSFYAPQMGYGYEQVQQVFHPGFQQSQADFAAWANAYHHMVAASMAAGQGMAGGMINGGMGAEPQPQYYDGHRRTNSLDQAHTYAPMVDGYGPQHYSPQIQQHTQAKPPAQPQTYHPYKRGQPNPRPSRDNTTGNLPRSSSTPAFPSNNNGSRSSSTSSQPTSEHHRHSSADSRSSVPTQRPPIAPREASFQDRGDFPPLPSKSSAPPSSTIRAVPSSNVQSQPLHPGPIAKATNAQPPTVAPRPSPLSQSTSPSPEPEKIKSGLKSRFKKALEKESKTLRTGSTPPSTIAHSASVRSFTSPLTSTPATPPQLTKSNSTSSPASSPPVSTPASRDKNAGSSPAGSPATEELHTPSAPFVAHPAALNSDVSLAPTDHTATGAPLSKGKRSLFRMKNMSTDNISLSSTVSSASMMIRKMGSIGKLARRNSLMGISKIFKDKPKDEDAALPEKDAKSKKDKKKKKSKGKGDVAEASVSHTTAEHDREVTPSLTEEEDRSLAGLSPAAKLARQHTLRSRAEAAQKEVGKVSGEPTWDNNTTTRHGQSFTAASVEMASASAVVGNGVSPVVGGGSPNLSNVVHVRPRQTPNIVHAVPVPFSDHEYDSEDDSSEGETVEDVAAQFARSRLSDGSADRAFREAWGNAWIDKSAVPKKGILKNVVSSEDLENKAIRQRSNSTADSTFPHQPGPMSSPPIDPDRVDGFHSSMELLVASPMGSSPSETPITPPTQPQFQIPQLTSSTSTSSFPLEHPSQEHNYPYQNPSHNTSAPTLSRVGASAMPLNPRSMTAPSPAKRKIIWAPECAVYSTYDSGTYDRRSEPATCNRLTPELALAIKQELNAFKLEMPVHPQSRIHTHYFA